LVLRSRVWYLSLGLELWCHETAEQCGNV